MLNKNNKTGAEGVLWCEFPPFLDKKISPVRPIWLEWIFQ